MKKRTQVLLDKKFQFRTTFSIIFIVLAIFLIFGAIVSATAMYNNRKLQEVVVNQKQLLTSQYEAFSNLLVLTRQENCIVDQLNRAADEMANKVDRSQQMSNEAISTMENIIAWNYVLIFIIAGLLIIQCAVLFVAIIRKTHRIIAPAKLMASQMDEIVAGKNPQIRPLRADDELKELYSAFSRLVEYIQTLRR
ncbi:MAG: hypothetical protein N2316_05640 [Spirochaetes bacterium]|nr:hypothetical protein [Spirochaetota bacterium]